MEAPAKVAGLLVLALAGYAFPTLGLGVAFLFGFYLMGRGASGALGLKLAPLPLLVFSVLASVALSAHATYWASNLFGYSRETVFLVFALSGLLFIKSDIGLRQSEKVSRRKSLGLLSGKTGRFDALLPGLDRSRTGKVPRPDGFGLRKLGPGAYAVEILNRIRNEFIALRKEKTVLLYALLFGLFVLGVLGSSTFEKIQGGIANGGWNWSDFFVHLSFATTLNAGIFPAQTPFFAGEPLIAHYFTDLHAALLSLAGRWFEVPVMVLQSAVLASALFLAAFLFADHFVKERKTAILAAFLLVLGGGFGFLGLFDDLGGKDPLWAPFSSSFDNNWDRLPFQVPSVLGTVVLTHRANSAGFPLLMLALWLFLESKDRKGRIVAGALAGLLMPFSYHAFAAGVLLFSVFLVLRRRPYLEFLEVLVPAALLSAPFLIAAVSRGGSFLKFFPGWLAPKEPAGFLAFYLANFGIVFFLALLAFLVLPLREKRTLVAGAAVLFLVPNVVSFTAVEWDMNRFFQFMTLFTAIPAAVLLRKAPKPLLAMAVVIAVASPLLVSAWFIGSDLGALSDADLKAVEWMRQNTKVSDVFVTEAFINQPTDVAGRLRLLTFTPYARNYALDPEVREKDTRTVYCGSADQGAEVMKKYGATHILYRGNEGACPHAYRTDPRFEKVFSEDRVEIYRLKP